MEESQILEWVAKEGEKVQARQVLVVVETEKTSFELEAQYPGILHIITPVEETIPVGHLIAVIADTQEEYEKVSAQS
jgi:pyruvate/2-oxoglutarate dehydrogenase complex dihydrolipoamide acyltransferase (E2) component